MAGRKRTQPKQTKAPNGEQVIDAGRAESEKYEPSPEVAEEFTEAQRLGGSGGGQMIEEMMEHHSKSPLLSGGDIDAAWDSADSGEETVGGSNPTPDQDVVEELGQAVGVTYQDNEPLRAEDKVKDRDRNRWELDPASSEHYRQRSRHEGEFET
ncbi:MAG TPA: DUF6335 family protein [Blastocatellia bacterium]|nr:DUF6335 family protein [Blastocatellia bacterium]